MIHDFDKPSDAARFRNLVREPSGLSEAQITWIRDYGDDLKKTSVKLYGGYDDNMVKARGSHFPLNDDTRWLYKHMESVARRINGYSYDFDLTGFTETFYFHTYDGALGEHFGWHVDAGAGTPAPRKLSLVLQLSSPDEYEGGDFEVKTPLGKQVAVKGLGLVTAFPSFRIHRVTPVTRGVRRALVMFAGGPHFR